MEEKSVHLRQATGGEIPILLTVLHAAFEEYRGRLDPPSGVHNETVETLRQKLKTGAAVLARIGDDVAGCVFYQQEPTYVYLERLSVLPTYRRQGVGRALVDYVEQKARRLKLPVQIGVRLPLADIRVFYERLGYRVVRCAAHEGYSEPTYAVMQKDLR
ncbi:MAG TPA: GNAT family N-acetyltransferase [bacterium]|nr:GNAT family N-acetyltransferase [bacterium]